MLTGEVQRRPPETVHSLCATLNLVRFRNERPPFRKHDHVEAGAPNKAKASGRLGTSVCPSRLSLLVKEVYEIPTPLGGQNSASTRPAFSKRLSKALMLVHCHHQPSPITALQPWPW